MNTRHDSFLLAVLLLSFSAVSVAADKTESAPTSTSLSTAIDRAESDVTQIEKSLPTSADSHATMNHPGMPDRRGLQRRLDRLADRLEDAAEALEDQSECANQSWAVYPRWHRHFPCETKQDVAKHEADERRQWFFTGITFRGALSDSPKGHEQFGIEAGLGLPVAKGIDLGVGAGNLFRKNGSVVSDARIRMYLDHFRQGAYIGGGHLFDNPKRSYGTFGLQGDHLYAELNMRKGESRPVSVVPQLGLRFRM